MGEGYNFNRLKTGILALSDATTWDEARQEWRLDHVYDAEELETCLCGHHPIIEVCVLRNPRNNSLTEVGNICVHRFMKLASKRVFDCLKRIRDDDEKAPNSEVVDLFYNRGILNDWERDFALDTVRKRNLSGRQLAKRKAINKKILANTKRMR